MGEAYTGMSNKFAIATPIAYEHLIKITQLSLDIILFACMFHSVM